MRILILIAVSCWATAILVAGFGLDRGNVFVISAAVSLAIAGVLFFALERALSLLTEIRDALTPGIQVDDDLEEGTAEDLAADLERVRAGLPPVTRPEPGR